MRGLDDAAITTTADAISALPFTVTTTAINHPIREIRVVNGTAAATVAVATAFDPGVVVG